MPEKSKSENASNWGIKKIPAGKISVSILHKQQFKECLI